MIKVLNIITDSNIGGAGKCVLTFAKNYDRNRFDFIVAVPRGSMLIPELVAVGANYVETDDIKDESFSLKGILSQLRLIRTIRPDIVHTHASMAGRIAARLVPGVKIIYTRHCVFEPSALMKSPVGKMLNHLAADLFSDGIIAVAQAAADNLTDVGIPSQKIDVILNGIEKIELPTLEMQEQARKRFGILEGQKVVSIIARLEEIKGHSYFIEASRLVRQAGIDAKFIIAGTGSFEQNLRNLAHEQNADVLFTGFLSDIHLLLGVSDISVNASFGTEATSLALLEGMSMGKPAVVSDYGGNPGVIASGENGIVVPQRDAKALSDGIIALLSDQELYSRMSQKSFEIFQKTFTSKAMTRQIEEVYQKIASQKVSSQSGKERALS